MKAAYCWAIDDALRAHGIEIPFPQRDIRVRSFFGSEADEAVGAFHGEASSAVKAQLQNKAPSVNDAADEITESDPSK
jgi:small-conductance mechanosensitive channel